MFSSVSLAVPVRFGSVQFRFSQSDNWDRLVHRSPTMGPPDHLMVVQV